MSGETMREIGQTQLERLERLTDCVYAFGLVLVIQWLPLPEESTNVDGRLWVLDLFAEFSENLIAVLIGLVFIILYWLRSNKLLAFLERTDSRHTWLWIASLFFLLLLLYMVRISGDLVGPSRRAGQSAAVALIGLMAAASWWHATKKGLVYSETPLEEQLAARIEAYTEPLVALVTLPFAFVGDIAWNLSWLLYIPVAAILRRMAPIRAKKAKTPRAAP